MKETINIGILGLGVVGSGTVAVLQQNRAMIERKVGAKLNIRKIGEFLQTRGDVSTHACAGLA